MAVARRMTNLETIELVDLLRLREEEFMRVWTCEQEIRTLLGLESFPFPAPPELPSRRRTGKGAAKRLSLSSQGKSAPEGAVAKASRLDVRKLEGNENAYRIVFEYGGKAEESFQTERELVRLMLNTSTSDFRALAVEAVDFRGPGDWSVVETLWKKES